MRKAYIVSEESESVYKGGISAIIDCYFSNRLLFESLGYSLTRINPMTFKIPKNRFLSKLVNLFRIRSEQRKVLREIDKDDNNSIFHIHSGYGFVLLKSLLICKKLKKKGKKHIILSIHFADFEKIFSKHKLINKYEQKLAKRYVDKIILLSKHTKEEFIQHGFLENKLDVLYTFHSYGVSNLERISRKNANDIIQLLFVGSIDKRKGVLDLIQAVHLTTNTRLKIVFCGSSNDKEVFDKFSQEVKTLKNASYVGYIKGEEKNKIFSQADVLVLPSYGEGLPVVIMEAMHFGCGIISTNVGSISEILIENKNCFFFKPGEVNSLTSLLDGLNNSKINEMKTENVELSNKFTCENNIKQLCSIYGGFYE